MSVNVLQQTNKQRPERTIQHLKKAKTGDQKIKVQLKSNNDKIK